jgi:CRP/FNR family transcriptional regulator
MNKTTNISLALSKDVESRHTANINTAVSRYSILKASEGSSFDRILMERLGSIVTGKRRIGRNERLFREHERLGSLYVIRFGQFKLIGNDSNGNQIVVAFLMAGDWLGLNAIATGYHDLGVIALDDSEILEVPFVAARNMMGTCPAIQHKIFEAMSEALNKKYHQFIDLNACLESRFAHFLIDLGERYASFGYARTAYRLSMSRTDIGSYLGATGESISRMVRRFNATGIVSICSRNCEVHDWGALDALSRGYQMKINHGATH